MRVGSMGKRLHTKITALKVALAALRLSLPSSYLNPTRNALAGESCIDHHMRLTNILHMHMARLIVSIPHGFDENETEFAQGWLDSLGLCQMIVSVVEQWDNQHSPRIDPAIVSGLEIIQLQNWTSPAKHLGIHYTPFCIL